MMTCYRLVAANSLTPQDHQDRNKSWKSLLDTTRE